MTDSMGQEQTGGEQPGTTLSRFSRRTLLGFIVAMWSAGSLSDARATRLLYGVYGYGQFGYGGHAPAEDDDG